MKGEQNMKKATKRVAAIALTVIMAVGLLTVGAGAATHTVTAGENLSAIAQKYLGDSTKWKEIYEANKDKISNPNSIYVGQELTIPGKDEPTAPAEEEASSLALVEVESGWYLGTKESGVYTFKGIQYGVAERFKSAVKPEHFNGIHTASAYGNACPSTNESLESSAVPAQNYMTPNAAYTENENCLYLNVWSTSMDITADMPVLVFMHGGGTDTGAANELTYYEGANFAKSQDVVFVSVNHRLNILGYTDLSAYGEEYKNSGNLGQEDLVLALEWVRDNIEKFGGDPDNVTIMGQSGGGIKVTALMTCPAAEGLFHRAIMCSGTSGILTQTGEQSRAAGVALVEKTKETYGLTTDAEALDKLAALTYNELYTLSSGTGVGGGPTIDGTFITESPVDPETLLWSEMADEIPMMITFAYAEFNGAMSNSIAAATVDPLVFYATTFTSDYLDYISTVDKSKMTEAYKDQVLTEWYGEQKETILAAFAKAYPELEAFDVTRLQYRSNDKAIGRAKSCTAPTYQAVWAYEFPLFGGMMAWHTGGDLPFLFNNLNYIENMVAGDRANAQKLADLASTMLGNFCRTGDPSTEELTWDAFTLENGETMIFNSNSEVRNYHDAELMELLNATGLHGSSF